MQAILVDNRNFDILCPTILAELQSANFIGLDLETQDSNKHAGLVAYNKGRPGIVFDQRRQVVCGLSIFAENAYYFNLNHADVQNRIPWPRLRDLLDQRNPDATILCHNASFELTVLANTYGYHLTNVVCTLQLCVSAYSPDEYAVSEFVGAGLGAMSSILPAIYRAGASYSGDRNEMTPEQAKVFGQIVGKESEASFSYNGFVKAISYGYGLKAAVKSWFGHSMTTYEEVVGKRAHMGELTGDEVAAYGCDDAYWCVRLFHRIIQHMMQTNPKVIQTFFHQENPMVTVYADVWQQGLAVNLENIHKKRQEERATYAAELRKLRAAVRSLLPFPPDPNKELARRDPWYQKNPENYRTKIRDWALLPDSPDDLTEVMRVSGAISTGWASDLGRKKPEGLNPTYYMTQRVLLYDLIGAKLVVSEGKTQSDGEARGKIRENTTDPTALAILDCLATMAAIETRGKLFLNPYTQLTDPETNRLYPVLSSRLATRRMAMSAPNGMQLTKRGDGTWVRGFYEADYDDHVLLSLDWSAIELLLIGEFSGDPEYQKAYGQLPHQDLHAGAAVSVLSVVIPEMTDDLFHRMKGMSAEELDDINPRILLNVKGERISPDKSFSYWRTEVGKSSSFEWPYSGSLRNTAEKLGLTRDQMFEAVERYKTRFAVAEQWRLDTIMRCQRDGYVELPDGHRRTRFEATSLWRDLWLQKFFHIENQNVQMFVSEMARAIQTRSKNQAVNALIQGTCATLAKRSILAIKERFNALGWGDRDARLLMSVHDELVFSVHRDLVVPAIDEIHAVMCYHPSIVRNLKLDASPSIGLTFEPYGEKAPFGQIELYEAPKLPGFLDPESFKRRLQSHEIKSVIDYLFQSPKETKLAA